MKRIIIHRLVSNRGNPDRNFKYMLTVQYSLFELNKVNQQYVKQFLPKWIQPL